MKLYTYKGDQRTAAGGKLVFPDTNVELDEKDPHVQSLVEKKLLVETEAEGKKGKPIGSNSATESK